MGFKNSQEIGYAMMVKRQSEAYAIDALGMQFYSSDHPRGSDSREIRLNWEMPVIIKEGSRLKSNEGRELVNTVEKVSYMNTSRRYLLNK